ncbi:MAG: sugar ABC transporter permease [Alphaproteobacteria bacterium]|nr:sugar ABC transporter permease [Alphaproteobacteria bacterium]
MMAPAIAGLVWYYLFNSTFGWYHWLFQSLGILGETSIIGSTDTAMAGIVMVDIWQWTPLITLITLAGMKRVPRDQLVAVYGQLPLHRCHHAFDRWWTRRSHKGSARLSL